MDKLPSAVRLSVQQFQQARLDEDHQLRAAAELHSALFTAMVHRIQEQNELINHLLEYIGQTSTSSSGWGLSNLSNLLFNKSSPTNPSQQEKPQTQSPPSSFVQPVQIISYLAIPTNGIEDLAKAFMEEVKTICKQSHVELVPQHQQPAVKLLFWRISVRFNDGVDEILSFLRPHTDGGFVVVVILANKTSVVSQENLQVVKPSNGIVIKLMLDSGPTRIASNEENFRVIRETAAAINKLKTQ